MTKLEPTRTSSDLTATERLRSMLDECGVEWDYGITGSTTTMFSANGTDLTFTPMRDGLVCSTILTPEQAIAVTLGDADATSARQSVADLKDENAKLRKLVIEVFECARRGAACETCKVNNDGYACVHIMRELGIEVD